MKLPTMQILEVFRGIIPVEKKLIRLIYLLTFSFLITSGKDIIQASTRLIKL